MAVLPDPGRSRAVLIGASTYSHLEDLPAVRNNLPGFRDVLVAPALGGLSPNNCTIVAEPARPVDVYRTLRDQAAAAEDTLLIYFAGHGRTGSRNELWLCLPDTDPDELWFTALGYEQLREAVADSRATKKVVILDCCFSGRALADQAGDEETILGQIGIEGTYILTATAANAVALAPPGERYTAFTGTLLGLLNEGIHDGPELLTFGQIYPRLHYTLTSRQLPRPRQQGSDTIAHLALTRNLAYTEPGGIRDFNKLNERFTVITAQLGHEMMAPRLAGVHAMADLADDWPENRQTCVDALCGYLRTPYVRDPGQEAPEPERSAFEAIREIRHTVIQVIAAHLKEGAAVSWQGLDFDFTGVVFDGGDFADAVFSGGTVDFRAAEFSGGPVDFTRARFSGGQVNFSHAEFSPGTVRFGGTEFSGGTVHFSGAKFSGSWVGFYNAQFSGGQVDFNGAEFSGGEFSGGEVRFDAAEFSSGTVSFDGAEFSGGGVIFYSAKFSGGTVDFRRARFSGGRVRFGGAVFSGATVGFGGAEFSRGGVEFYAAEFSGGEVDFNGAEFSGGEVDFNGAEFSGGRVGFDGAEFSGGGVDFPHAQFSGGQVDFIRARFSGGRVDFARARRWSHPPMFREVGKLPAGVVLPVQPFKETRSQL